MEHENRMSFARAAAAAYKEQAQRLNSEADSQDEKLEALEEMYRGEPYTFGDTINGNARILRAMADAVYSVREEAGDAEYRAGLYLHEVSDLDRSLKSRTEIPAGYPDRFVVAEEFVPWRVENVEYNPPYYTAPKILAQPAYADPESEDGRPFGEDTFARRSSSEYARGMQHVEGIGWVPRNPVGRTGIQGRGELGRWGANFAADPIISRNNPETGLLEIAMIQRANGEWAIPGGMVDAHEDVSQTIEREFNEEAGVALDMSSAKLVYRGYVDDPRNTDNAWMETTAKHLHLDDELGVKVELHAGSDARAVRWMPVTAAEMSYLFASHEQILKSALRMYAKTDGLSEVVLGQLEELDK